MNKCLCVQLISSRGKSSDLPFALTLEVTEDAWKLTNKDLSYPLQKHPHVWFVNEISQSKYKVLTISLFSYFVTKPPLTFDPHKK